MPKPNCKTSYPPTKTTAAPQVVANLHRSIVRQATDPPSHRCPLVTSEGDAEGFAHALLRVTVKLMVFHWINSLLGATAFTVVACGTLLCIILTPLCCLGVVLFQFVPCIVAVFAELDVGLTNFVSLPEEHISASKSWDSPADARACGETSVERLKPGLSKFSAPALRAMLYFLSVKAVVGVLSSLVLSISFSLPVGAITRGNLGDNFHGVVGHLVFLLATILLLIIGIPLMQYGARLSRTATVYFCCERFTPVPHHHVEQSRMYGSTWLHNAA